jgi:hypothetical protein
LRELLHRFDEVAVLGGSLALGTVGERLSVGGEQGEAEREGGRGEHGKGLDQNVGDGVGLKEVGVELVAIAEGILTLAWSLGLSVL